jgi:hypothetical protein
MGCDDHANFGLFMGIDTLALTGQPVIHAGGEG